MTLAEAIFFSLAHQASTPDLKAKKLLFDVLIKLQQANICHPSDRLPEIQLDEREGGAETDVSAAIDRVTAALGADAAPREDAACEQPPEHQPAENAGSADAGGRGVLD